MKQQVQNYTFDKVAKTVTFTDFTTINLDDILLVTDVTTTGQKIIYNFADTNLGGTVATNVLTLTYNTNTASYVNTDKLQIFYDYPEPDFDTGGGKVHNLAYGIAVPASGGPAVVAGDTSNGLDVDVTRVSGTVSTKPTASATSSATSATVNGASTSLAATNSNRLGVTLYNEGPVNVYVTLGATATATAYAVQLTANAYYEVPFGWTGAVTGITAGSNATMRITELTA